HLVRPQVPGQAHLERRALRHVRHDRGAHGPADPELRARHQPRERQERRGAHQRPRPLPRRSAHRSVLRGGVQARLRRRGQRAGRGRGDPARQERGPRRAARRGLGIIQSPMPRVLAVLLALLVPPVALADAPDPPALAATGWLLLATSSGQGYASRNPEERVEPASLTKLMTAYVAFEALKGRAIALGQTIPVSERAWRASGSRMFIEPRKPVTVQELLHGMIIQSGNDACIALAEAIAGSEAAFVERMNRDAQRIGMKGTHFTNASGMPNPEHYSTPDDLALLASALIRDYPEYYKLYSEREYRYNDITQLNRNRLLWLDPN